MDTLVKTLVNNGFIQIEKQQIPTGKYSIIALDKAGEKIFQHKGLKKLLILLYENNKKEEFVVHLCKFKQHSPGNPSGGCCLENNVRVLFTDEYTDDLNNINHIIRNYIRDNN